MMATRRSPLALVAAALLVGCGIKRYDTFEVPGPTDDHGGFTVSNDHGLRVTLSATCDPKHGFNAFFVTFSATTTAPVNLLDAQVTETISSGTTVRTIPPARFTVNALVHRSDDSLHDRRADAPSVAALPEDFRVVSQAGSGVSFNQFSFAGDLREPADSSSPNAVSLRVAFGVSEGTLQRHETRTIRLTKTSHRYFWFLRDD